MNLNELTITAEPEDPRVELLAEDLEASGQCCFDIWPCDRADEWRNDARNILARLDAAGGRVVIPEMLAELRRLLDAATPVPWAQGDPAFGGRNAQCVVSISSEAMGRDVMGPMLRPALFDVELIVAAVNALPALLDAAAERDRLAGQGEAGQV